MRQAWYVGAMVTLLILIAPIFGGLSFSVRHAYAADPPAPTQTPPAPSLGTQPTGVFPGGFWGPLLSCTGSGQGGQPSCANICDVVNTAERIIFFALTLLFFVIVPIMVMWAGVVIMTAGGNAEKVGEGKKLLMGTFVGLLLGLVSYILVSQFYAILKPQVVYPGANGGAGAAQGHWYQLTCTVPATTAAPAHPPANPHP
jgi:Type IV secretion system pilin